MLFYQLKNIRNFFLVCDKGSFQKAAESAFVSRQALSKSVSTLEKELGVILVTRSKQGVHLTEFGKYFYKSVVPIFTQIEQLERELTTKAKVGEEHIIRLNIFPSSVYLFPYESIKQFAEKYTGQKYQFEISEYPPILAREKLVADELDIIIEAGFATSNKQNTYGTYFIKQFHRLCLVPKDNLLSLKDTISSNDLNNERLALCMNAKDYDYFLSCCQQKKIEFEHKFVSETDVMYELSNRGEYIGLSFDFIAAKLLSKYSDIIPVPFEDDEFTSAISLIFDQYTVGIDFIKSFGTFIKKLIT